MLINVCLLTLWTLLLLLGSFINFVITNFLKVLITVCGLVSKSFKTLVVRPINKFLTVDSHSIRFPFFGFRFSFITLYRLLFLLVLSGVIPGILF